MKPRCTVIPHAGYPFDVMLAIGMTDDALFEQIEAKSELLLTDDDRATLAMPPNSKGRTVMLSSGQTIIRLWYFSGTADDWGHLAHEIFHAVDFLMNRIGIRLSRDSDEAFAYAIGNLTRRAAEALRKRK